MLCSMSRKGDCWDNAVAESFLLYFENRTSPSPAVSRPGRGKKDIFEYIEVFYKQGSAALDTGVFVTSRVRVQGPGESGITKYPYNRVQVIQDRKDKTYRSSVIG